MDKKTKAVFNTKYLNERDVYSDGEIEQGILARLQNGETPVEILKNDNRWPVLYHFSPQRHNLLSWMDIEQGASVLEIGASCGGITGLLCEKFAKVTAVELSLTRSKINYERYKDFSNLEIMVGNLNDIDFTEKYDYATLIGVLEYCGRYTEGNNPYLDFLKKVRSLLKPEGKLIIAIENPTGIKYWAGANEDHYGKPFVSIEGYIENEGVRTFHQKELKSMLEEVGFFDMYVYYPMPDYKLPGCIVADGADQFYSEAIMETSNYGDFNQSGFKETSALENLTKAGHFSIFANSLLLITTKIR